MSIIIVWVLAGTTIFVLGIVFRRLLMILLGLPAALLFIAMLVLMSMVPDPETEFDYLFGEEHRAAASDIRTSKPTLMDGHFISFHMSQPDFEERIRPRFSERELFVQWRRGKVVSSNPLLGAQRLPKGWPESLRAVDAVLHLDDPQRNRINMVYLPDEERAFATVWYAGW